MLISWPGHPSLLSIVLSIVLTALRCPAQIIPLTPLPSPGTLHSAHSSPAGTPTALAASHGTDFCPGLASSTPQGQLHVDSRAQHTAGASKSHPTPGASQPSWGPYRLEPPEGFKALQGNSSGKVGENKGYLASLLCK